MSSAVKNLAAKTPSPISLASLHRFATSIPTAIPPSQGAILSHKFLAEQVSIRAAKRFEALDTNAFDFDGLKRLSERYQSLADAQSTLPSGNEDDEKLRAATSFGKWLHSNLSSLDTDVSYVQEQLKDVVKVQKTVQREAETQQSVNQLMESIHVHLVTWRLLSSQHDLLLSAAGADTKSKAPAESSARLPISIGSVGTDLHQLVEETAEDCRAFCIEKNGEAPEVKVVSAADLPARDAEGRMQGNAPYCLMVEGHVHFMLMEVLKNSMGAMVQHWGRDLIDAPPIQIQLAGRGHEVGIRVSDYGGGIPVQHRVRAMDFFHTSAVPMKATYGYSKAHGAAFTGMGVGFPMARLYARLCGGDLSFNVVPGFGTDTFVILNRTAETPFPV